MVATKILLEKLQAALATRHKEREALGIASIELDSDQFVFTYRAQFPTRPPVRMTATEAEHFLKTSLQPLGSS